MSTRTSSSKTTSYAATLPIHMLKTRNGDGEPCYFVLRTSTARYTQLLAKKQKEPVNIADYGEILASGYGHSPQDAVLTQLKKRHNIDLSDAH